MEEQENKCSVCGKDYTEECDSPFQIGQGEKEESEKIKWEK